MLLQGFYVQGRVDDPRVWVHDWGEFALYLWVCAVPHYLLELFLGLADFYSFLWRVHRYFLEVVVSLFIVVIIDEIVLINNFLSEYFFQFRPVMLKTLNI